MRRHCTAIAAVAAAAATALAAAGCGGGKTTIYDRDATASCLSSQAAVSSISTSKDDLDFIAQSALGGGIYVKFPSGNDANVSFERTVGDANRTDQAYKAAGAAFKAGNLSDLLKQNGNVVIAFSDAPTSGELDAITGCLAKQGQVKAGTPPPETTTAAAATTTSAATPSIAAPSVVDKTAILAAIKAAAGGTPIVKSRFQFSKTDPSWAVVGVLYKGDPQGEGALVHKSALGWKVVQSGSALEDCRLRYPVREELAINCMHVGETSQPFQEQLIQTPTTNIQCDVYDWTGGDRSLSCALESTRNLNTTHPLSPKVWTLTGSERVKLDRHFVYASGRPRTLPYGTTFRAGAYQCVSRFTGLTCKDTRSGHGFFLSREAQTTF